MKEMKNAKNKQHVKKKYSDKGIVSFVLSLIAFIFFCVSVIVAYQTEGNITLEGAVYGFCSLLISIIGVGFSISGFFELERDTLYNKIGLVVNGILFGYLLIIIIWINLINS